MTTFAPALDLSSLPKMTYELPDRLALVTQSEATLRFPAVATLDTYRQWMESVRQKGDEDDDTDLRLYRAARAISTLEITGELAEEDVAVYAESGDANQDLDVTIQSWVIDCAEAYLGPQLIVQSLQQSTHEAWATELTSHRFDVTDMQPRLPGLAAFSGTINFPVHLRARHKRKWETALLELPAEDPAHVDNSMFLRQYRAALTLMETSFVSPNTVNHPLTHDGHTHRVPPMPDEAWHDPKQIPLVLASFLVKAADLYMMVRTDPKKLRRMFAPIAKTSAT